jgi:mannose-6-phosphate isomerase
MPKLYPLHFRPIYREYLWGGRRLETILGKALGPGDHFAESWEVVDRGADQSLVENGPLAGTNLHQLVEDYPRELFGRHFPQNGFPLLFKFLDAARTLSVQVHPNDDEARRLDPPDLGKTEAWVVIAAEPGSRIYAGLKTGIDRRILQREIQRGTCEVCLHSFEPHRGDCVFIPAGTVHALGAGLVVAEIQQASDTTFRLYDWNRSDPRTGQPRPLHVNEALDVIDYDRGPVNPVSPVSTERNGVERLVDCPKFVLSRWMITGSTLLGGDHVFHLLAVIDGAVELAASHVTNPLMKGNAVLLPAECGPFEIVAAAAAAVVLDVHLPPTL